MDSTAQSALSAVRTILAFLAGLAVSKGYLQADQATEIVGAVMVLVPLAWGMYQKRQAEASAQARETVAVQAGVAAPLSPAIAMSISPARAQSIIQDLTLSPAPSNTKGTI
jgi:NADH:ubiquinone oxidoreductase subunit 6 (subunit J)